MRPTEVNTDTWTEQSSSWLPENIWTKYIYKKKESKWPEDV